MKFIEESHLTLARSTGNLVVAIAEQANAGPLSGEIRQEMQILVQCVQRSTLVALLVLNRLYTF
jgi:hypothetical protein